MRWVAGVLGLGVVAALPFARWKPTPPGPAVTLDPRVSIVRDLPPRVTTEIAASPAVGLQDQEPLGNNIALPLAPTISRSQLDDNGLPPDLPERYHSMFNESQLPGSVGQALRQTKVTGATAPQVEPEIALDQPRVRSVDTKLERTHRVVDGDTLARLAKRYWGDEKLAAALFNANQATLSSPDPLPLGVTLRIPAQPPQTPVAVEAKPVVTPAVVKQPLTSDPTSEPLAPIPPGSFGK